MLAGQDLRGLRPGATPQVHVGLHTAAVASQQQCSRAARQAARGIIIDGAGIGSAIAANKVPGIRAALCYDRATARNSREHNDANVLILGGRLLTVSQAEQVVRTWLATPFAGGRHLARLRKITELEQRYAGSGR